MDQIVRIKNTAVLEAKNGQLASQPRFWFYLIGFFLAVLEEFITQGVLKKNLVAWIIPTFIAFLPFLFIVRLFGKQFDRRMEESRSTLYYYLTAGGIGLLVEWFLIGLAPWGAGGGPFMIPFQLGMFSFWGSVALAPRLILDRRDLVSRIRKWYRRYLTLGIMVIYFIAFTAPKEDQFILTILAVLITFIFANAFYFTYIRTLKRGT